MIEEMFFTTLAIWSVFAAMATFTIILSWKQRKFAVKRGIDTWKEQYDHENDCYNWEK